MVSLFVQNNKKNTWIRLLLQLGFIFVLLNKTSAMNYIDYIIIILLAIAAVRGAIKGFIYEVASLIALIAGVWGAIKFSSATETFLVERLDFTSKFINIIAFALTFILIIVLVHFLGKAIEKAIESISLGVVNRVFGLLFSLCKTAFVLGIVVILIEKIDESIPFVPEDDVTSSKLYSPLRGVAVNTFPFIKNFYDELKNETAPKNDQEKEEETIDKNSSKV